ncbi:MAG: DUF3383 family protein [Plesiomonas shigelloides]
MTTPIYRRFRNQTLLLDTAATTPVLDVGAFLTTEPVTTKEKRFITITADDYKTALNSTTMPITYAWAQTYFGQDLKPASAVLILLDASDTTPDKALDDAALKGVGMYELTYIASTDADTAKQLAVAKWVQAYDLDIQCTLITSNPKAFSPTDTTDIGYQVRDQKLDRTTVIYHPTGTVNGVVYTNQRPDAALVGRMLPTYPEIGGIFEQWDYKQVSMVSDSGLTADQQKALIAKGYNFVERFTNTSFTHVFPGRTCTYREIRIQWAADWFDANVAASLANYAFRNPLMAYDDQTFADVETIYRDWGQRAIDRRVLTDFTITMPDPEKIPAAVRATGKCNINDLYFGTLNSGIDEWSNTGKWSIGGV